MKEFNWSYLGTRFSGRSWLPANFKAIVILIHGIGEHTGRYAHVAAHFNHEGFGIIGIDHYGHGKSEGKRGASQGYEYAFDYLDSFLEHVQWLHDKPVLLYGHSMGGGMAMGYILKRKPRIKGAIISSPAFIVSRDPGPFLRGLLHVLYKLAPGLRIPQGLDLNKISRNKSVAKAFLKDGLNHGLMSIQLAYEMIENGKWCLAHAHELATPVLLIHGDADEFTSVKGSRYFAGHAPAEYLSYREWKGGYHELHNDPEQEEVLDALTSWAGQHL